MAHDETIDGVPNERTYTHTRCGESTIVAGHDFQGISMVLLETETTYCTTCGAQFPVEEYTWDDTGERISDAQARLAAKAPAWARLLNRRAAVRTLLALGFAAGGWGGFVAGVWLGGGLWAWLGAGVGAIAGAIVLFLLLTGVTDTIVLRKYYGVHDWPLVK